MHRAIQLTAAVLAVAVFPLAGCQKKSTYTKVEPAQVEHKEGEEISKLTLTEKAMERLAVATAPVREASANDSAGAEPRSIVPYSALVYLAQGDTFVYTSPAPRTFIRQRVEVDSIQGDDVVLKSGPSPGTEVAVVGAAELFGTEFGVGH